MQYAPTQYAIMGEDIVCDKTRFSVISLFSTRKKSYAFYTYFLDNNAMMTNIRTLLKQTLSYGIITLAVLTLCYVYLDRPLAITAYHELQYTAVVKLANFISTVFDPDHWLVLFVILSIVCIWQKWRQKLNPRLAIWALSLFLALGVATVIKVTLARYRPELFLQEGLYGFHWFSHKRLFNSFPSGHATLAFAGLLGLTELIQNKKITILCIALALVITISRILSTEHYLGDVLGGVYIGVFSYLWANALEMQLSDKSSRKV
ncbi:phosphatase PAP2 family protein [Caedibacter taeniospiralis]|uniref:phosphatase PAP2 family protein n=1 Tax=Caedibacter taeniospiralis TaxID=28907 RepID=UPI000C27A78C|nr:phosphatase PAP2 family protein [Caedibacter taeniospiralis]